MSLGEVWECGSNLTHFSIDPTTAVTRPNQLKYSIPTVRLRYDTWLKTRYLESTLGLIPELDSPVYSHYIVQSEHWAVGGISIRFTSYTLHQHTKYSFVLLISPGEGTIASKGSKSSRLGWAKALSQELNPLLHLGGRNHFLKPSPMPLWVYFGRKLESGAFWSWLLSSGTFLPNLGWHFKWMPWTLRRIAHMHLINEEESVKAS